jgi:hypothetical protein
VLHKISNDNAVFCFIRGLTDDAVNGVEENQYNTKEHEVCKAELKEIGRNLYSSHLRH